MFWLSLFALIQLSPAVPRDRVAVYERGRTFDEFIGTVAAQRELWLKNVSRASVPTDLVGRLRRVSEGLRLVVVAEDWCVDSANTLPYIAALASLTHVDLRVLNRTDGGGLMKRHPSSDGRSVTPTVVLLRGDSDVGAWVERPAALQQLFRSMSIDPESVRRFSNRQAWYDADHGRTTLEEVVTLAEETAGTSR